MSMVQAGADMIKSMGGIKQLAVEQDISIIMCKIGF